ncbi:heterokaryon incompatibility protein-domain-containing protein [Rhexocercosporidium sp. MPI-PUGE-AT-0058]|nr:heterokaryon incompatibility protein-domain-containing protein [Rhexocercosporidium sp. MPI-PUGE-AT-0058]
MAECDQQVEPVGAEKNTSAVAKTGNDWIWFNREHRIWMRMPDTTDLRPPIPYSAELLNTPTSQQIKIEAPQFFQYQPLDHSKRDIRVLSVCPRHPDNKLLDNLIVCSLVHVSLLDKPPFAAISYTWGADTPLRSVLVNNRPFYIRQNLWDALDMWRYRFNGGLFLWADAICINQDDPLEKNEQVKIMSDIYRQADSVFAWLGPPSEDSDLAIQELSAMSDTFWEGGAADARELEGPMSRIWAKHVAGRKVESLTPTMKAISTIFQRPYWNRAWVQQEIALSRDFTLFCGWPSIRFDQLVTGLMADVFMRGQMRCYYPELVDQSDHLGTEALRLNMLRSLGGSDGIHRNKPLKNLLLSLTLNATDPRDLVYALLGIATDAEELHIIPDYTKTCQMVYTDVALSYLTRGDLQLLGACQFPKDLENLPSWVPDWSSKRLSSFLSSSINLDQDLFSAVEEDKPRIWHDPSGVHVLSLKGIRLGTVRDIGKDWSQIDPPGPQNEEGRKIFRALAVLNEAVGLLYCHDTYPDTLEMDQMLFRGLIGNRISALSGFKELTGKPTDEDYQSYRALIKLRERYSLQDETSDEDKKEDERSIFDLAKAYSNHLVGKVIDRSRRVFVTSSSSLGLAPIWAQVDDIVCIFSGYAIPFLIRPASGNAGRYTIVGEAYVYRSERNGDLSRDTEKSTQQVSFDLV